MTVLFIFAHPDDETIFAGGTIVRHAEKGDRVFLVSASSGERGGSSGRRSSLIFYIAFKWLGTFPVLMNIQNIIAWFISIFRKPDEELAATREEEARKAARIYEVPKPIFLGIEDMRFDKHKKKILKRVESVISRLKPDLVYVLHPNGLTGHPDHRILSKHVLKAVRKFSPQSRPQILAAVVPRDMVKKNKLPLIGVPQKKVDLTFELSKSEFEKKMKALKAYKSQKYLWEIFLQKSPELLKKEYFLRLE